MKESSRDSFPKYLIFVIFPAISHTGEVWLNHIFSIFAYQICLLDRVKENLSLIPDNSLVVFARLSIYTIEHHSVSRI